MRSILRAGIGVALGAGLASCVELTRWADTAIPSRVAGLPSGSPILALPIRAWVTEGAVTAEALAGCADPSCAPAVAVGIFRVEGEAAGLRSLIADPTRLRREIAKRAASAPHKGARTPLDIDVKPLSDGDLAGFTVTIAGRAGNGRVTGAVLAATRREPLRFVFAVGADDSVIAVARTVAEANLR